MIAVRLLPLEFIEEKLRSVGCKPVQGEDYKTATIWVTPWGHHFTKPKEAIPEGPDGAYGFGAIWAEIEKTKPAGWPDPVPLRPKKSEPEKK